MNGVQGVASSNLVIPTRISGSCDGESRLPFLLNFFCPGHSSHRAVFSRDAGASQSHLVPRSRGRIALSAETSQAVSASDALPRTRRSWLVFSALSCSSAPVSAEKPAPSARKRGERRHGKMFWGTFHDVRSDSVALLSCSKKAAASERRGFSADSHRRCRARCPRQSERDSRDLRCSRSVTANTPG